MVESLHGWANLPSDDPVARRNVIQLMHKIVHGDPSITHWIVEIGEAGNRPTRGMGKSFENKQLCTLLSLITLAYLSFVTELLRQIIGLPNSIEQPGT